MTAVHIHTVLYVPPGHSSDSSSNDNGTSSSGGSDNEEGEKKGREEGSSKEGGSTGSLDGDGQGEQGATPAGDGGEKAPKPKTTEQQVRC